MIKIDFRLGRIKKISIKIPKSFKNKKSPVILQKGELGKNFLPLPFLKENSYN